MKDGEIITAVTFTAPAKAGYAKFRNPASRYAMVGVFVAKGKDGVRVAVTGAGDDGVFRSKEIEAALAKKFEAVGARRRHGAVEQPDERHPRLGRISRQSRRGHGQARGGRTPTPERLHAQNGEGPSGPLLVLAKLCRPQPLGSRGPGGLHAAGVDRAQPSA